MGATSVSEEAADTRDEGSGEPAEDEDFDLELRRPAPQSWRARTATEMIVSGIFGLIGSFVLSIEAWQIAANSSRKFSCDVSSVLSCSTVAQTWQARVLGFPNAYLGIMFEAVVLSVSVAMLAGVRFPCWYMLGVEAVYTVAIGFALWLFTQSFFVIHVLCPWCLLITVTTTLVWSGLTRINLRDSVIPGPARLRRLIASGADWWITGLFLFALLGAVAARYGARLFG